MRIKHFIVISLLLAILTMSVVSASDNSTQIQHDSLSVTNMSDESISAIDNSQEVVSTESQDSNTLEQSYESHSVGYDESDDIPNEISFIPPRSVAKGNPVNFAVTSFDGNMVVKIDGIERRAVFVERADEVTRSYDVSTEGFDLGEHVLSIDINSRTYGHVTKSFTFKIKEIIVSEPINITIGGYDRLYIEVPTKDNVSKVNIFVDDNKVMPEVYGNYIVYEFNDLTAPVEGYIHKLAVEYGDIYNETFLIPTFYQFSLIDELCWYDEFANTYEFLPLKNLLLENFIAKIDGKTYPIKKTNTADFAIDVSNLKVGKHIVEISYYEEGKFYNHTEKAVITMIPKVNVDHEVKNGKGSVEIIAPGNLITAYVHIYNKNDDYRFAVKTVNGKGVLSLAKLNAGTYNANVEFEGITLDSYTNYVIVAENSKLTAKNLSKYYGDSTPFKVNVKDYKGKIVKSKYVKFYINGKYLKKVKTDKKGYATLKIAKIPGKYNITVKYGKVEITRKLTVNHCVTLKKVAVKKSAKSLTLKATLKQGKKALKYKKVTFKFNGKTYKAKTNKKGVAKVTIKKSVLKKLKVGKTVIYQATYLKDTVKKTAIVKK